MQTKSQLERLRVLGQLDLGAAIEVLTGEHLWSIQKQIATAISRPRAKVAVPSCNASGKTWLAGRIALAFYNSFTPGTPCFQCGGPCRGSKIITTSSKYEHLRDNMWGEIRRAVPVIRERGIELPGRLYEGDLRFEDSTEHFITGQSAASAEGMQGYHAAHKLIIGDEATSVDDEVQLAITRLLSSADSRLLLIYNPTTPDTYASRMSRAGGVERIKITAWDTPSFTGESMPEGANLITPHFLEDLKQQGMGPGTFEWNTSIEANDWDLGDDLLIPYAWYDLASGSPEYGTGTRQIGVDLASYGSDECVIAVRDGDQLIDLRAFPSMRIDSFFQGPVTKAVQDWQPHFLCYDADGVGAGAIGYAEAVGAHMPYGSQVIGFRGGKSVSSRYLNARSAWYWALRRRFENRDITLAVKDDRLRDQVCDIHYSITPNGDIRVETKAEMKKRGVKSPDRADAVMYAFAFSSDLLMPDAKPPQVVPDLVDMTDHSEEAMWKRIQSRYPGERKPEHPVLGVTDW